MQKKNRIMMIAVSSLLCLTLISSCLVSGVFARYVTKDSAKVSTVFKKFGITVTAEPHADLAQYVTSADGAVTLELNNVAGENVFKIKPGDDYSDAIRFTITGTAEVPVEVKISPSFAYTNNTYYKIPKGVGGLSTETQYMPLGFTFGGLYYDGETYSPKIDNDYVALPWLKNTAANAMERVVVGNMLDKIDYTSSDTTSDTPYVLKKFEAGESILFTSKIDSAKKVNAFDFGFVWPMEWSKDDNPDFDHTVEEADQMMMYLYSITNGWNDDAYKLQITYTIQINQIQSTN